MHDNIKRIIEHLGPKLVGIQTPTHRGRVYYNNLSVNTSIEYAGIKLRDVITPPLPPTANRFVEQLFDFYIEPLFDEVLNPYSGMRLLPYGDRVARFMRGQSRPFRWEKNRTGAVIRLLHYLGATQGVEREFGPATLMLHVNGRSFGIKNQMLITSSEHLSGRTFSFDEGAVNNAIANLFDTGERASCDRHLAVMYKRLKALHDGSEHALLALMWCDEHFRYKRLFEQNAPVKPLTDRQWANIEDKILHSMDPIGKIYPLLVPAHMTRHQFKVTFGERVVLRDPSLERRTRLFESLAEYIWIKTRGQEE